MCVLFLVKFVSGIVFYFKIIEKMVSSCNTEIHNKVDLFLDKIFITVIVKSPQLAPKIFSRLASQLNGDEMAKFMSGECSILTKLKVIFSMPKLPFIKSFFFMLRSDVRN
mgnify:CR=1 FL=1